MKQRLGSNMKFVEENYQLPWAYAIKPGFKGDAAYRYYRYFRTEAEAKESLERLKRKNRWHGEIEYRPGETYAGGYFVL